MAEPQNTSASAPLVRLDMLINGERVDALAAIVHQDLAQTRGRQLVETMRNLIPRQQLCIPL